MKPAWVLLSVFAGFAAPPVMAQINCIPKEVRTSLESSKQGGLDNLSLAQGEYSSAKAAASIITAGDAKKAAADRKVQDGFKKLANAETSVIAQSQMASRLLQLDTCLQPYHSSADTATAASAAAKPLSAKPETTAGYVSGFPELDSKVEWNQRLLIFLIFLFILASALLFVALLRWVKRVDSSLQKCAMRIREVTQTQTEFMHIFSARTPSQSAATQHAVAASPKGSGQIPERQSSAQDRQANVPPFQGTLISNGNTQYAPAAKAKTAPESLFIEDDSDGELSESEIWPILLPMAANLVETVPNLDSASLTRELIKEIECSRPGLAKSILNLGFEAISGRLAPDGRETSRNPEMFAIELTGKILLFPSPRSNYKSSFDAYFEGANTDNWRGCLQAARVQKTGDNLLSVIERGISGR